MPQFDPMGYAQIPTKPRRKVSIGLIVTIVMFVLGWVAVDFGAGLVVASMVVFVVAIKHGIMGRSFLTVLWRSGGRRTAALGVASSLVMLGVGGAMSAPTDPGIEAAPAPGLASSETPTASPEPTPTTSETPAAAPTPTPSPAAASPSTSAPVVPAPAPSVAPSSSNPAEGTSSASASAGSAAAALALLPIKGRAPKTGYDRDQFGQRWADIDRNGCDQRNDILNRDLTNKTYKPGTRDCVVLTGTLADPFTGTTINFVRGEKTSSAVQVDHVLSVPAR